MPVSWAVVRLAGAWPPGWVATVAASWACSMKRMGTGSPGRRRRVDRAKSMHGWPVVVPVFTSAVIPGPDPSGRGMLQLVLPTLVWIGSPIAPVTGLVASKLYSLPVLWVAL